MLKTIAVVLVMATVVAGYSSLTPFADDLEKRGAGCDPASQWFPHNGVCVKVFDCPDVAPGSCATEQKAREQCTIAPISYMSTLGGQLSSSRQYMNAAAHTAQIKRVLKVLGVTSVDAAFTGLKPLIFDQGCAQAELKGTGVSLKKVSCTGFNAYACQRDPSSF